MGWGTTDGVNWKLLNDNAGFSKRSGNLMVNVGGSLFTFGGYGFPVMKKDGYCLAAGNSSNAWNSLGNAPWYGRYDYDMEVVDSNIVLLAGEASLTGTGGPYFNDVWVYNKPKCS